MEIGKNFRGKSSSPGDLSGFLDVGSHFEGELKFDHSFRVDGKVVGKVISDGDLVVGEKGEIDGEIRVGRLFVSGLVKGEVLRRPATVDSPARQGRRPVHARALIIEEGGILEGESSMMVATHERTPSEAAPPGGGGRHVGEGRRPDSRQALTPPPYGTLALQRPVSAFSKPSQNRVMAFEKQ